MPSPNNYSVTLKLDLDLSDHVSCGRARLVCWPRLYLHVGAWILVNCRFGMKLSASVSSPFIYRGTEAEWPRSNCLSNVDSSVSDDASWKAVLFGSGASPAVASIPIVLLFPCSHCASLTTLSFSSILPFSPGVFHRTFPSATPVPLLIPALADVAIVSSEASAEAPIEVPTEAACSAVESAFSPAVAAQAMVSVFDCDVAPHSYDKPFWERSSRRKVVALPSLHMAMVDYNDWLITYDSRGSVVFQPREP
ncbi:hypothetical protein BASA61_008085 [Batrachochytrium salamandrivorans]|nr:hypothetical protein BASA61_008085 [Batrachochytrium salamandrivorans]